jgi:spore coat protein U-like protein
MIKRLGTLAAAFAVVSLGFATGPAFATSSSSTLTVNGSVTQSCTTLSPATSTLTFSAYDSFANANSPVNASEVDFTTSCTKGASGVNFSVNGGQNCTHSSGLRSMHSSTASDYLNYNLYEESTHSTVWPFNTSTCAASAGPTLTISSSSSTQTLKIFGQIPAGQDPTVASDYTDTVTVAINY